MRVLLVNKFVHVTGGADVHCRGLASILTERGHDVAFLSTVSEIEQPLRGVFVRATVTHASRGQLPRSQQVLAAGNAFWNRAAAAAMRRLLDEFRPDVVHAHKLYPQLSVAPVVVAARSRIPVVQTLHDFELVSASSLDARGGWRDRDESHRRYRLLNTATHPVRRVIHRRSIDAFVSVSRYVARVYSSRGIESHVLANFLPAESNERRPLPFAERDGIIFVGRLKPEKGVKDVVALAERLPDLRVTVVGSGELQDWVAERASRLRNLSVAGFVDSHGIGALMGKARLLVAPSRWQEPGPLTVLEAMAQGTPVIAYPVGGLAEYVSDANAGCVVPSDVDSLVRACRDLHDGAAKWEQLSAHAVAAVGSTHSPTEYAKRIESVYESMIRRATSR